MTREQADQIIFMLEAIRLELRALALTIAIGKEIDSETINSIELVQHEADTAAHAGMMP